MKKTLQKILFAVLLFNLFIVSAQKSIEASYTKYFEETREIPYLHLNKSVFLTGEEIWFQAYILEQNSKKLHPTTSNLYVSIFSSEGKLKDQKLIEIRKGLGAGSILLDSTYSDQYYFLKASTRWMKNFKEDNAFVSRIQIVTNSKAAIAKEVNEKNFFDFQVFPEGGHFIKNTINSAGILIKDKNGKGQKVLSGFLKNNKTGDTIQTFVTNRFGTGKLTFLYEEGLELELEAELANGSLISKKLEPAKTKGVNLIVKNPNTQFVEITLATNEFTLPDLVGKTYSILIHNTKEFYKKEISFSESQKNNTLFIKNAKLFKGPNIITIFNEKNTPILERIIYNHSKELFAKPVISKLLSGKDSTSIGIENMTNQRAYLSASFLPLSTIANDSKRDIYGKFLLEPFVKGDIENAAYYFTDVNRKKLTELDQLLLTQGWSKYNWTDIFKSIPKKAYPFENGIDFTIATDKKIRNSQSLFVYSDENRLIRQLSKKENPFTLKNSFIKKDSDIYFGLKYGDNVLKIAPSLSYSNTKLSETISSAKLEIPKLNELSISNYKVLPLDTEQLKGFELSTKIDKPQNIAKDNLMSLRVLDMDKLIIPGNDLRVYIENLSRQYINSRRKLKIIINNEINPLFNDLPCKRVWIFFPIRYQKLI